MKTRILKLKTFNFRIQETFKFIVTKDRKIVCSSSNLVHIIDLDKLFNLSSPLLRGFLNTLTHSIEIKPRDLMKKSATQVTVDLFASSPYNLNEVPEFLIKLPPMEIVNIVQKFLISEISIPEYHSPTRALKDSFLWVLVSPGLLFNIKEDSKGANHPSSYDFYRLANEKNFHSSLGEENDGCASTDMYKEYYRSVRLSPLYPFFQLEEFTETTSSESTPIACSDKPGTNKKQKPCHELRMTDSESVREPRESSRSFNLFQVFAGIKKEGQIVLCLVKFVEDEARAEGRAASYEYLQTLEGNFSHVRFLPCSFAQTKPLSKDSGTENISANRTRIENISFVCYNTRERRLEVYRLEVFDIRCKMDVSPNLYDQASWEERGVATRKKTKELEERAVEEKQDSAMSQCKNSRSSPSDGLDCCGGHESGRRTSLERAKGFVKIGEFSIEPLVPGLDSLGLFFKELRVVSVDKVIGDKRAAQSSYFESSGEAETEGERFVLVLDINNRVVILGLGIVNSFTYSSGKQKKEFEENSRKGYTCSWRVSKEPDGKRGTSLSEEYGYLIYDNTLIKYNMKGSVVGSVGLEKGNSTGEILRLLENRLSAFVEFLKGKYMSGWIIDQMEVIKFGEASYLVLSVIIGKKATLYLVEFEDGGGQITNMILGDSQVECPGLKEGDFICPFCGVSDKESSMVTGMVKHKCTSCNCFYLYKIS